MSMSVEHAEEFKNEVAVVCCRTEEGTILSPANLEDPAIFPDMVDSGLLTIPDDCLKIGEVIGAKLLKTIDSLSPLTPRIVEGVKVMESEESIEKCAQEKDGLCIKEDLVCEEYTDITEENNVCTTVASGVLKIKIEEGRGINIEIPFI